MGFISTVLQWELQQLSFVAKSFFSWEFPCAQQFRDLCCPAMRGSHCYGMGLILGPGASTSPMTHSFLKGHTRLLSHVPGSETDARNPVWTRLSDLGEAARCGRSMGFRPRGKCEHQLSAPEQDTISLSPLMSNTLLPASLSRLNRISHEDTCIK